MKKLPFCRWTWAAALVLSLLSSHAHSAPGDLYVAADTGHRIYKFTPGGHNSIFASDIYQARALAFDRSGNILVGNSGAGTDPRPANVLKFSRDGKRSVFATISSDDILGMAFDGRNNLFVSTGYSIVKVAPNGTQSTFASGLDGVWPLAFDKFGNLYAGVNPTGPRAVLKFAPDGSSSTFATFAAPGSFIIALAFDRGGDLFVTRGDSIVRVKPDGSSSTFATATGSYFASNSLAFDANGTLFAGKDGYNSTQPAILKFAPDGTSTTFAMGPLLPNGFAFEPVTEKLRNLSARGFIAGGDNILIGGFIVGGNALANNAVVVRAIGPSLGQAGVSNPVADPVLELHDGSGAVIASNNDWQETQKAQITATGLAPKDAKEAAIFATLPAGSYTAVVRSTDNTTGNALVEIYSVTR